MNNWQSGGSPKIDADFDAVGDGNGGDFLNLASSALKVDVALEDGHFPVVPSLGTFTARRSSAADPQVLVGESHGTWNLHSVCFGVAHKLVGHLLHGVKSVAAESDSRFLHLLIFNALLLGVLVSHSLVILQILYIINLINLFKKSSPLVYSPTHVSANISIHHH